MLPLACRMIAGFVVCGLAFAHAPSSHAQSSHEPAARRPKAPAFDVVPWSLTPVPGSTEAKLGLRAERQAGDPVPGADTIVVFGKRMRRAPVESELIRRDEPGAEAWQSDAAQSYVPAMGDSCSYKSGCFDKSQPGLLDTVPTLFGNH